jgi:AmpD protein
MPRTEPAVEFGADGILPGVRFVASPNCDSRPPDTRVTLLVLHGISLPPGEFGGNAIEELFTNRLDADAHPCFREVAAMRVSAHFLVRRDGAVVQFVPVTQRAWHAGKSAWRTRERCNDHSVGVELEGTDVLPYAGAQYASLATLASALMRALPITACAAHSDVAPGRKTDPGQSFDWPYFHSLLLSR